MFDTIYTWLNTATGAVNDVLYTYILIALLVAGGIFFTIRTKFAQFRLLKAQFQSITEKPADGKGVSSFRAKDIVLPHDVDYWK